MSDRLLSDIVEATIRRWFVQFSGILFLFTAIAGWLCLVSWSVKDPSLSYAVSGEAKNLLGSFGANLADVLFQTVGLAAIVVFLPVAAWGWYCISYKFPSNVALRLSLWPISVLLIAGGLSVFQSVGTWPLNGLGGMLGDAIIRKVPPLLAMAYLPASVKLSAAILFFFGFLFMLGSIAVRLRDLVALFAIGDLGIKSFVIWIAGGFFYVLFEIKGMIEGIIYKYEMARLARQRSALKTNNFAYAKADEAPVFSRPVKEETKREKRTVLDEDYPKVSLEDDMDEDDIDAEEGLSFDLDDPLSAYSDQFQKKTRRAPDISIKKNKRTHKKVSSGKAFTNFKLPNYRLLDKPLPSKNSMQFTKEGLVENAEILQEVLSDFGVLGTVNNVHAGPVVTLYEFEPARGTKSARVIGLANDIARSMSAVSARVSVIPGRNAIGIELPNEARETVYLRALFESRDFLNTEAELPLVLGRTIGGDPIIVDLARMPHLLIAGTTGSGKSVGINAMILSLLFQLPPDKCKMIMIDPKMLELSVYDGIPHMLSPVVTDPKKAVSALKWAVQEMEERYKKMSKINVRNISGYNARVGTARSKNEKLKRVVQTGFDHETGEAIYEHEEMDFEPLPYIVIVIDEMADLMMVAGKEIEAAVQRLAQMARAAGIHLITATQRPSVDVITGTIKANFPTRISYQVSSKIDSRTILGEQGAEQLLGSGDMLYLSGAGRMLRVHGPFVTDQEIETVVDMLSAQGVPEYLAEVTEIKDEDDEKGGKSLKSGDQLYDKAVDLILKDQKVSISYVQRRLSVGYNRAATLIERMEDDGLISPPNNSGKRQILVN